MAFDTAELRVQALGFICEGALWSAFVCESGGDLAEAAYFFDVAERAAGAAADVAMGCRHG